MYIALCIWTSSDMKQAYIGAEGDVGSKLQSLYMRQMGFGIVGTLILVGIMMIMIGRVSKNINCVCEKLQEIVDGEKQVEKLHVSSNNEIGVLAEDVNKLIDHLECFFVNIHSVSDALLKSVAAVSKNATSSANEVESISSSMEEINAVMQQTSSSAEQIQALTSNVNQSIQKMYGEIEQGVEIIQNVGIGANRFSEHAVEEAAQVKAKAEEIAMKLNAQIRKSQEVEKVNALTQEILNITSQTNLLALNASIEAARAGEAGKGFSVVADEISKLAENSAHTATEIENIVKMVTSAVSGLVCEAGNMMTFLNNEALSGYDQLQAAGDVYKKNVVDINGTIQIVKQEAEKIEANAQEINESMEEITEAVKSSAEGINTITDSTVNLVNLLEENRKQDSQNEAISLQLEQGVNKFTKRIS